MSTGMHMKASAPTRASRDFRLCTPRCLAQPIKQRRQVRASVAHVAPAPTTDQRSLEYSRLMKDAMGWENRPYDYDYSRGLYYHEILPGLFCGSQPRHAHDIEELKRDLGVSAIVSLQQDKDMHHWGVNPDEIRRCCAQMGIQLHRRPVQDFDPHSLRKVLPSAVNALHQAHSAGQRVYVHCTAGLGRAPGVIIAYMYWFHNMDLHQAYDKLTSIRPCGPKKEAIRGATYDLIRGHPMEGLDRLPKDAYVGMSDWEREKVIRCVPRC